MERQRDRGSSLAMLCTTQESGQGWRTRWQFCTSVNRLRPMPNVENHCTAKAQSKFQQMFNVCVGGQREDIEELSARDGGVVVGHCECKYTKCNKQMTDYGNDGTAPADRVAKEYSYCIALRRFKLCFHPLRNTVCWLGRQGDGKSAII